LVLELLELGYTSSDLKYLKEKTLKFGGLESIINTISYALNEAEIQEKISSINKDIKNTVDKAMMEERKLEEIKHEAKIIQFYFDYAKKLLDTYKLDPVALQTILTTAQQYGQPTLILQALNTYGTLRNLEENVQSKLEILKTYDEEISKLQAQKENHESMIADLYRRIGAIEEKHKQSRILQNIVNLLNDPLNADIRPSEFMIQSLSLLIGIRDYSYTHVEALPKWDVYVKNHIDTAVNRINNILVGKL
jgi:hypothetical protein